MTTLPRPCVFARLTGLDAKRHVPSHKDHLAHIQAKTFEPVASRMLPYRSRPLHLTYIPCIRCPASALPTRLYLPRSQTWDDGWGGYSGERSAAGQ
jgi:hypothetical protein